MLIMRISFLACFHAISLERSGTEDVGIAHKPPRGTEDVGIAHKPPRGL